jgi:hypothetical protein
MFAHKNSEPIDKPEEAVRQKLQLLCLEVVEQKKIACSTSLS